MFPATFIAFDVLYVDRESVMGKLLLERKGILASLKVHGSFSIGDHIIGNGIRFFEACAEKGLEGVWRRIPQAPISQGSDPLTGSR